MSAEVLGLPPDWRTALDAYLGANVLSDLAAFLAGAHRQGTVLSPETDVFTAFRLTPYGAVRVVIVGQDPYPTPGEAHGLAFSVVAGVKPPRSPAAIHRLMNVDLGLDRPEDGSLVGWAEQGVLLLNTVLTVGERAGTHLREWSVITDAIIRAVSDRKGPHVVFVLWGARAQRKGRLLDKRHPVVMAGHPVSRLGGDRAFTKSRSFSRVNDHLRAVGVPETDWSRTAALTFDGVS